MKNVEKNFFKQMNKFNNILEITDDQRIGQRNYPVASLRDKKKGEQYSDQCKKNLTYLNRILEIIEIEWSRSNI